MKFKKNLAGIKSSFKYVPSRKRVSSTVQPLSRLTWVDGKWGCLAAGRMRAQRRAGTSREAFHPMVLCTAVFTWKVGTAKGELATYETHNILKIAVLTVPCEKRTKAKTPRFKTLNSIQDNDKN